MKFLEGLVVAVVSAGVGVIAGTHTKDIMDVVHTAHVFMDETIATGTGMVNDVTHTAHQHVNDTLHDAHVKIDQLVEEFKAGYAEGKNEQYVAQRKAELSAKIDAALKITDEATRVAAVNAVIAECMSGK